MSSLILSDTGSRNKSQGVVRSIWFCLLFLLLFSLPFFFSLLVVPLLPPQFGRFVLCCPGNIAETAPFCAPIRPSLIEVFSIDIKIYIIKKTLKSWGIPFSFPYEVSHASFSHFPILELKFLSSDTWYMRFHRGELYKQISGYRW